MNITLITMGGAFLLAFGLVVSLGGLSLLSGAFNFLFCRPKIEILKSTLGRNGLAFSFRWPNSFGPVGFDQIQLRLFNPFGSPTQIDIKREFKSEKSMFALDLDLGEEMNYFISADGFKDALVQIEMMATRDGICHQFDMKGHQFLAKIAEASGSVEEFNNKYKAKAAAPLFQTVQKSFVAPPMESASKTLKIATNPEFAGEFSDDAGSGGVVEANFAVAKVWIEPGCIVCDACEAIFPEVFEVLADTCIIRDGAPLDDGLKIAEAAEACPVEVIKFNKA